MGEARSDDKKSDEGREENKSESKKEESKIEAESKETKVKSAPLRRSATVASRAGMIQLLHYANRETQKTRKSESMMRDTLVMTCSDIKSLVQQSNLSQKLCMSKSTMRLRAVSTTASSTKTVS
jgi:hypothetical protein